MSDIVEELHWTSVHGDQMAAIRSMDKAAKEILRLRAKEIKLLAGYENDLQNAEAAVERLKAALQEIADMRFNENSALASVRARAALEVLTQAEPPSPDTT